MPRFESVSLQEALSKTARPSKRTEIIREYVGYISQLRPGKAGRIQAGFQGLAGDQKIAHTQRGIDCNVKG